MGQLDAKKKKRPHKASDIKAVKSKCPCAINKLLVPYLTKAR